MTWAQAARTQARNRLAAAARRDTLPPFTAEPELQDGPAAVMVVHAGPGTDDGLPQGEDVLSPATSPVVVCR